MEGKGGGKGARGCVIIFVLSKFVSLQGLDVLEIMRHIHVFVTRYCYNLNNQVGVATRRGCGT